MMGQGDGVSLGYARDGCIVNILVIPEIDNNNLRTA